MIPGLLGMLGVLMFWVFAWIVSSLSLRSGRHALSPLAARLAMYGRINSLEVECGLDITEWVQWWGDPPLHQSSKPSVENLVKMAPYTSQSLESGVAVLRQTHAEYQRRKYQMSKHVAGHGGGAY